MVAFTFYIQEMKYRVFYILFSWFGTSACFYLSIQETFFSLQGLLRNFSPMNESGHGNIEFICTDIPEIFVSYFFLSLFSGGVCVFPYILYQIWCFLLPSFWQSERTRFTFSLVSFFVWFLCIGYIAMNFVFPFLFSFFLSYASFGLNSNDLVHIQAQVRIQKFVSFFTQIFVGTYCLCALPVLFFIFLQTNLLNVQSFFCQRRLFYLSFFILTALFSPPDFFTQFCLFFLWISIFELTVFFYLIQTKWTQVQNS